MGWLSDYAHNFVDRWEDDMPTRITPEQLAKSGSEHAHQTALFCWAALPETKVMYPELKWMFAIPNGGFRDKITAGKLKAEGVKPGVWDIFLPVPIYGDYDHLKYVGLWIEMKAGRNDLTEEQAEFGTYIAAQGLYRMEICWSWQAARDMIIEYLGKN
jgi:hypothetical protein